MALLKKIAFLFGMISFLKAGFCAPQPTYYLAARMLETPKYKEDFISFSYANPLAPKGGEIHLYTSRQFDAFNPFLLKGVTPDGIHLMYAQLMKSPLDDPNVSYPYVADRVTVDKSHTSVTFFLNPRAKFHDGSPITSEDVKFSYENIRSYGIPIYKAALSHVETVTCPTSQIARFHLKSPSTDVPFMLGKLFIFSKKSYAGRSFNDASLLPLGSGPYRLSYEMRGGDVRYQRVKNWWGAALPVNRGFYNFDTIHYILFINRDAGLEGFKKGILDVWNEDRVSNWMTQYDFEAVKKGEVRRYNYRTKKASGFKGLFINLRRPHLQNRRVRRALNLLFNFEWLNSHRFYNKYTRNTNIYTNSGFGSSGPLSAAEKAFLNTNGLQELAKELEASKPPSVNKNGHLERRHLDEALKLFLQAGWAHSGKRLLHVSTKEPFKINLLVISSHQGRIFENYINTLKKIGIEAEVTVVPRGAYFERLNAFDYDLIFNNHPPVNIPGPEQEDLWGSKAALSMGTLNLSGIQNPLIDKLIATIKTASTLESLKTYTSLLDRVINLEGYLIPGWIASVNHLACWNKFGFLLTPEALDDINVWWTLKR